MGFETAPTQPPIRRRHRLWSYPYGIWNYSASKALYKLPTIMKLSLWDLKPPSSSCGRFSSMIMKLSLWDLKQHKHRNFCLDSLLWSYPYGIWNFDELSSSVKITIIMKLSLWDLKYVVHSVDDCNKLIMKLSLWDLKLDCRYGIDYETIIMKLSLWDLKRYPPLFWMNR